MLTPEEDRQFRSATIRDIGSRIHCLLCDSLFDVTDQRARFIAYLALGDIDAELVCPDCSAQNLANFP